MLQVNAGASRAVWFLYEQRLLMADYLAHLLPPLARQAANLVVLEPLLALGGVVTGGLLAGIDLLGAFCIAATNATLLVPGGMLLGLAMAAGLGIGVTTLVLSQRVKTDLSNVQLLRQDLCMLPGLLWGWLKYALLSTAQSRLASGDARVSYGATLGLPCAPGSYRVSQQPEYARCWPLYLVKQSHVVTVRKFYLANVSFWTCNCCACRAGFKEMYCDVNPEGVLVNHEDKEKRLGPPRRQVFEALTQLLKEDVPVCFRPAAVWTTVATLKTCWHALQDLSGA